MHYTVYILINVRKKLHCAYLFADGHAVMVYEKRQGEPGAESVTTKLDLTEHGVTNACQTGNIMTSVPEDVEAIRRRRLVEINTTVESADELAERQRLEARYGQTWDAAQVAADFEVLGFMAPYMVVRRWADGRKGSLEFQHLPRFYFNFVLD